MLEQDKRLDVQESRVYSELKEQIATGVFPPGSHLVERELAERFGASRTPIRSAIKRLTTEGLLEQNPNRGVLVKRLNKTDAIELLYVREALETMACRLAAQNDLPEEKIKLMQVVAKMEQVIEANDFLSYYRLTGEFHHLILDIAQNLHLTKLVEQVNIQVTRFQFRNLLLAGRIRESVVEHREIAAAIIAGDANKAEIAIGKHVQVVRELVLTEGHKQEYIAFQYG